MFSCRPKVKLELFTRREREGITRCSTKLGCCICNCISNIWYTPILQLVTQSVNYSQKNILSYCACTKLKFGVLPLCKDLTMRRRNKHRFGIFIAPFLNSHFTQFKKSQFYYFNLERVSLRLLSFCLQTNSIAGITRGVMK
jgi:hypothetical protein